jgi:hypothetical protein
VTATRRAAGVNVAILPEPIRTWTPACSPSTPCRRCGLAARGVRKDDYASQRLRLDIGDGEQLYLVFGAS